LDVLQLVIIGVILVVIVIAGPKKIPELARALGGAKKEFDTAKTELKNVANIIESPSTMVFAPAQTAPMEETAQLDEGDDHLLVETAQKMGIRTQGMTREQIREEIVRVAQKGPAKSGNPPAGSA
jgi:sec-independent protein translocase protein TatA